MSKFTQILIARKTNQYLYSMSKFHYLKKTYLDTFSKLFNFEHMTSVLRYLLMGEWTLLDTENSATTKKPQLFIK